MGFTFGSPGHDARSVTVRIEKLSILGEPAAREVGGMEAWIEVEMPGLNHLLTTPRVQATAGEFVFACVLEAHIGLAAEAKLREALASREACGGGAIAEGVDGRRRLLPCHAHPFL